MSTSHGGHKADSNGNGNGNGNGLSRLGCALATQLQLTAAKTTGTLATLTHRLSRHAANGKFVCSCLLHYPLLFSPPFSFILFLYQLL